MINHLSISPKHFAELRAHLDSSEEEQVAFLFALPVKGEEGALGVIELHLVRAEEFDDQSVYYLALSDEVRARVIGRATELGSSLVEVHSHDRGPPAFSPTDLSGFEEWVPHVRWRLSGRPYVALVFVGEEFDALAWDGNGKRAMPLGALLIDGGRDRIPTGLTHARLEKRRP